MSRKTKKENRNSLALRHGHSEMTEARQRDSRETETNTEEAD